MSRNEFNKTGLQALKAASSHDIHKTIEVAQNYGSWIRAAQLPQLFCSWDLAYRCIKGGWLKPIVKGKRRTIYRLADVLKCMQRIEEGEVPPARTRRQAC
jgi:hypothetical protein